MLPLSKEQVVKMALDAVEKKIKDGKMIPMNQDFDWDDKKNYVGGDPESVYSICSLYEQFLMREDEGLIESALYQKYPEYF